MRGTRGRGGSGLLGPVFLLGAFRFALFHRIGAFSGLHSLPLSLGFGALGALEVVVLAFDPFEVMRMLLGLMS